MIIYLSFDICDAIQSKVSRIVELGCEGNIGKVRGGSDVCVLLAPLHGAACTDDVVLELGPGAEAVRGRGEAVLLLHPPPAGGRLEVAGVGVHPPITPTHRGDVQLVTPRWADLLLGTDLVQNVQTECLRI